MTIWHVHCEFTRPYNNSTFGMDEDTDSEEDANWRKKNFEAQYAGFPGFCAVSILPELPQIPIPSPPSNIPTYDSPLFDVYKDLDEQATSTNAVYQDMNTQKYYGYGRGNSPPPLNAVLKLLIVQPPENPYLPNPTPPIKLPVMPPSTPTEKGIGIGILAITLVLVIFLLKNKRG